MSKSARNIFAACFLLGGMALTSCDSMVFDDTADCKQGVALRFIYDYHMEPGANAFPANVDCVSLFIFDKDGNFIDHVYETSDDLRSEDYRMELPLEYGDYHLVAYGGLVCENPSFDINHDWANSTKLVRHKNDIEVTLPLSDDKISNKKLHDLEKRTGGLFYGTVDVTVTKEDVREQYRTVTLPMMKDTNNIQIILQELGDPSQMDYNDYDFTIIDDNFKLDGYNNLISTATETSQPVYKPYAFENRIMGYVDYQNRDGAINTEDDTKPVQVACVEFSTSRLLDKNSGNARLVIKNKPTRADEESTTLIDIPFITYLEAVRGYGQNWIKDDQEFLDRQSNWTMMFFLQNGRWVNARISVNAWTVRLNTASW